MTARRAASARDWLPPSSAIDTSIGMMVPSGCMRRTRIVTGARPEALRSKLQHGLMALSQAAPPPLLGEAQAGSARPSGLWQSISFV